ncbi:MAG: NAD(P)/FAD-dependent oxidoreductase [Candidatus Udaeobacter sp.]
METFDVAIVGGGPAGSSCAAFCAMAGLQALILEREKFPREKVCGDCLNPSCWGVLKRLQLTERVRDLPHSKLSSVEFISINGRGVTVNLPSGADGEISVKRSLFDDLLLRRARELGANVHEKSTVTALIRNDHWNIETASGDFFQARILIGADGRNSTVAHLCNLLPRPARERVALQAHIPLPRDFGNRIVLQFLHEGYSGQASVNETQLNLCLVGTPPTISKLRRWAERQFQLPADQSWRTITPLTRSPVPSAHENLFFIGDAARVVEPFTGEGIYYALRSGELAANAVAKIVRGENRQLALRNFTCAYSGMYRGRLWINRLARAAVLRPQIGSLFVHAARINPSILKLLTGKIVSPTSRHSERSEA